MTLSNLYRNTKARVATSLAALTLAGGIAVATPTYAQDIPDSTATNEFFIGPVEQYEFQGNEDFRARYGEEAFEELQTIQTKYGKAMQTEGMVLGQAAQAKLLNYVGLENIMKAQLFAQEVQQEFGAYIAQNDSLVQSITQDIESVMNGDTSGLEANLERYIPVIEGAIGLAKENALEYYQENQEFVDRVIADAKATFNDPEIAAASEEFQEDVKQRATTQFMDFYQRNKPVIDQLLQDAEATITDQEFWGDIQTYQDTMNGVLIEKVMGADFAAQVDSVEVKMERLSAQQDIEIQDLIDKLEAKRALEKGF